MDTHSQDSGDFITALTEAEEAGISKDDFLRIWDMEAKLRLLREVERSKGLKQQESKLQNSMTSTQGKINNGLNGNDKQSENSTQEVKKRPGLPKVEAKEDSKDLAKDTPHTSGYAATFIDVPLSFQTCKLQGNFDDMRKEFAEEMHQVRDELKSLKDELRTRCQKSVHDKLGPQISEQKKEIAGLREDVKQWRKEFVELKEAVLAVNKKLEGVNNLGSLNASVDQKLNGLERRSTVMDTMVMSCSPIDAQTQTFDNMKLENRKNSTGAGEVEKSGNVEEKQKKDQLNNRSKPESHQNKEQQLAQPQITQGDRLDLQQTQQEKQLQQQQLAQNRNVQERQGKGDQCHQQHHQQKQQQGPNNNQTKQLPQQKDTKKTKTNNARSIAEKTSVDREIPIFPKKGTILKFKVNELSHQLTGKEHSIVSPVYRLPNSSKTVSLCIWFNEKRKLNVQLLVFGLNEQSVQDNEVYSVSGQIKHDTSGEYTWLFKGKARICKLQGPNLKVYTSICLETDRGYEDISLDELKRKQYVCDNSLVIKWFVTCDK